MLHTRTLVCLLALSAGAVAAVRPFTAQQATEPTKHHERLLAGVGQWEGTITNYMIPGMEKEGMAAPCTETVQSVGKLWTTSRFVMEMPGMRFEGAGLLGWDVDKNKFVGTWVDSFTGHITMMEGDWNADTNAIEMHWEAADAATGEMVPHRSETVHRADASVMSFYMGEGDAEKRSMVIAMKRKPAAAERDGAGHDGEGSEHGSAKKREHGGR